MSWKREGRKRRNRILTNSLRKKKWEIQKKVGEKEKKRTHQKTGIGGGNESVKVGKREQNESQRKRFRSVKRAGERRARV